MTIAKGNQGNTSQWWITSTTCANHWHISLGAGLLFMIFIQLFLENQLNEYRNKKKTNGEETKWRWFQNRYNIPERLSVEHHHSFGKTMREIKHNGHTWPAQVASCQLPTTLPAGMREKFSTFGNLWGTFHLTSLRLFIGFGFCGWCCCRCCFACHNLFDFYPKSELLI